MTRTRAKVLFGFILGMLWALGGCQTTGSALEKPRHSAPVAKKADPEKISQARETLSQITSVNDRVAESFYQQGLQLEENGLPQQAIAEYRKAIKVKPSFAHVVYMQMGLLYQQIGQLDPALDAFSSALESNPDSALLYFQRSLVWLEKGDRVSASQDLRRALSFNPDLAQAHYHLGKMLWDSDRELATDHLKRFLALAGQEESLETQEIRDLLNNPSRQSLPAARASFPI